MNINIFAPISACTSYGCVSRNLITSLSELGHKVFAINIPGNVVSFPQWETSVAQALKDGEDWDTAAPCLKIFHANELITFSNCRGKKIAMIIFELDTLRSEEIRQINKLDAVVVCSGWANKVLLNNGITVPIHVAPLGVDRSLFNSDEPVTPNDISKDGATKFYLGGKWELRKGFDFILDAFDLAFESTDDAILVVNAYNHFIGQQKNDDWCLYYKTGKNPNKVFVLDKYLDTQKNVANLVKSIDVGIFCSRAEGWNLGALEAMSLGKHVIMTNVTAHTEFATKENALLIECPETEPAEDGVFFSGFGRWAKIGPKQVEEIASCMKLMYTLKREGRLAVNQAGIETAKRFSWTATAQACLEALI